MVELPDQKATTPKAADLDDAELLGFEHIEAAATPSDSTEDAVALALNKRGDGEGPPISSDRRLKTHVKRVGEAAHGVNLYSFR